MNSLALFITGLLLGVLMSLSFINRLNPVSKGGHMKEVSSIDTVSEMKINRIKNNFTTAELMQKETNTSILFTSQTESIAIPKLRWVPGKENSVKSKSIGIDADTNAAVNVILDQSAMNNTTNISELTSEFSKKGLRGKMKRKFLREKAATEQFAQQLNSVAAENHIITPVGSQSASTLASVEVVTTNRLNATVPRLSIVSNEFIPYHSQAVRDYDAFKAYVPSLDVITKNNKVSVLPLPDMSKQKGAFEKDNLKLHLCNGVFEAYSASYLTTKQHMLNVASESYNLSWVNCEMASFVHMKESNKFYSNPNNDGVIMQSLDVLDFSVIHLSAFERSSKRYKDALWKTKAERNVEWTKIEPVKRAGQRLALLNDPSLPSHRKIHYSVEAQRTVVIMPFLGGAMGAGHSELGNRFEYLKTCFWSFYEFIPNIVAGVTRQEDVDWCMKESGLPFYDIILLPNLPKSAGLPVGTTQQTKLRLQDGRWDFDYVFFTESDQILISRELPLMFEHLKKYPGHMVLPHRLMPYSDRVTTEVHKRNAPSIVENVWMNQSCCMPRQNCVERKTWLPIKDNRVPIINYYGLYVPLGNVNFLDESFRSCKLGAYVGDYCP